MVPEDAPFVSLVTILEICILWETDYSYRSFSSDDCIPCGDQVLPAEAKEYVLVLRLETLVHPRVIAKRHVKVLLQATMFVPVHNRLTTYK